MNRLIGRCLMYYRLLRLMYYQQRSRCRSISVEVVKAQHDFIRGADGSSIDEILALTNVSVEVPAPDDPSETVTLRGELVDLKAAFVILNEKVSRPAITTIVVYMYRPN